MKNVNYIEEVLLIIAAITMIAYNRFTSLELRYLFLYSFNDFIVCLSPVILLGLAFIIFIKKNNLLFFKKRGDNTNR